MKHIEPKKLIGKIKQVKEKLKQMILLFIIIGAAIIIIVALSKEDKTLYRESQVIKGNLARGVTESGSVDVGTAMQTFDLDISGFSGSGNFAFGMDGTGSQNSGMMMGMMPEVSDSGGASDRQLEVEQVYVEAGQEIEAGTPILKLTQESVEKIRRELSQDVTDAELVYQQALTSQKQAEADAEGEYRLNSLYADYSQAEYDETVSTLTQAVEKAQEALAETIKVNNC